MREVIWLDTERLRMRPILMEDVQDLYELNMDPEVIKYTGDSAFQSVEHCRKF